MQIATKLANHLPADDVTVTLGECPKGLGNITRLCFECQVFITDIMYAAGSPEGGGEYFPTILCRPSPDLPTIIPDCAPDSLLLVTGPFGAISSCARPCLWPWRPSFAFLTADSCYSKCLMGMPSRL
jgi:hypothetical protein